jgi:dihydropteroate synthase
MGVINATPDSFSDGGCYPDVASAVEAATRMVEAGADLIDVGGESSRPGADPVAEAEEQRRVLPVIEALKQRPDVRVSVDTVKPEVARRALDAGADLVNDIDALGDPRMLALVAERRVPVVLMHRRGTPRTMQQDTDYDDLLGAVAGFLRTRVESAVAAGVAGDKILVDPGLGFGKSAAGNCLILKELSELSGLGRPILIGASRKSFVGRILDSPVAERLSGSLAVAAFASAQGAHVVRAHDVGPTVHAVRMIDAIRNA